MSGSRGSLSSHESRRVKSGSGRDYGFSFALDRYARARFGGGWLCDRINSSRVILLGVALGIPMFFLQVYGSGFITLLIPLAVMTMGFGFTNVGATTFALQSASKTSKELSLGISRASSSVGQTVGPLLCGALIEGMGFDRGFQAMSLISLVVFVVVWYGLGRNSEARPSRFQQIAKCATTQLVVP